MNEGLQQEGPSDAVLPEGVIADFAPELEGEEPDEEVEELVQQAQADESIH